MRGTVSQFQEALLEVLERKDHAAWQRWTGPGVTRAQLRLHYEQEWLVFVRDFPRFLGRVHGNCPDRKVRNALAANLYEEETGGLSGGRAHPDLFLDLMEALGFAREGFDRAQLLPEAKAYRAWLDRMTEGEWVVGAAIATIWVEGSVHERRALRGEEEDLDAKLKTHFLVKHHGVAPAALTLNRAHHAVEGGHRKDAWEAILTHASDEATRARVIDAMRTACDLWHVYRDAVTRAAGV